MCSTPTTRSPSSVAILSLQVCRKQRLPSYHISQDTPSYIPVSVGLGTYLLLDLSYDPETSCSFGLRGSSGEACTGTCQGSQDMLESPPLRDKIINLGNPISGFICLESSNEQIFYTVTHVVTLSKQRGADQDQSMGDWGELRVLQSCWLQNLQGDYCLSSQIRSAMLLWRGEVSCFNKSQRFACTVGMLRVYIQSQRLGSFTRSFCRAHAGQTKGEGGHGSTAFHWVETRMFKGHAQSFGAIGGQGKNWKLLVYFLQRGFHLPLIALNTSLIFSA